MGLDGTAILDGDTAWSEYNHFMDLYDQGYSFEKLQNECPLQAIYKDDFENEIYITAIGLAYWEIGMMTDQHLRIIKATIEKNACINEFEKTKDFEWANQRKKVLDIYWQKINSANNSIKEREPYEEISSTFFDVNDVISYQSKTGKYRLMICAEISHFRGECSYIMLITDFIEDFKPTMDNLQKANSWTSERNEWDGFIGTEGIRATSFSLDHHRITGFINQFDHLGKIEFDKEKFYIASYVGLLEMEDIIQIEKLVAYGVEGKQYKIFPIQLIIK